MRLILVLVVLAFVAVGGASGLSAYGNYVGDGNFSVRDSLGGTAIVASGEDASMAFGHELGADGSAFAGLDADCEAGRFKVLGQIGFAHQAQAYDMTNISARASIGEDSTLYTIAGVGKYRERLIDAGPNGRPETVVEAEFSGSYDINTSAKADPAELSTMD